MLIRLLRTQLLPYRRLIVLLLVMQFVQTVATLSLPTINADIINEGVLAGNVDSIVTLGFVMFAFAIVQIVFSIGAMYFAGRTAMGFGRDLREALFGRVMDYSAREVGAYGAPSLITRITNDVQQVQLFVVMVLTMLVAAPLTMVVGIVMAVREDAGLSFVLVIVVPITAVVLGFLVSRMVPAFEVMQERIDQVNRVLREQITGIRVVRAFVREPEEAVRFDAANNALTATSLKAGRLMAAMFPTMTLIVNASSVIVLWIGGDRIASGQMEIGSLVAYLTYLLQILMAVVMASFMVSNIPRAAVSAARIQEVLDTEPSVVPPADPVRALERPGSLDFDGVGFHYPGAEAPVLSDISFATERGQTVAVIGSTGAGKTTLVNLIPRLFDTTSGSVRVGGVDVRDLELPLLRRSVGLVPQKPYLFSGTVASNLRYGRPEATEVEMWQALEIAQVADFVRSMPRGLDSRIAQGGTNVSGGQRQRLAIARALVLKPDVYVFDDSFSALDLTTDARLRAALAPHTRQATVVVVAQRVSTIVDADLILVLEDGRLVGTGTHDELLDSCPTYLEIVESQMGERETA